MRINSGKQDNSGGGGVVSPSSGRVTLAGGTTFSHTNILSRLPGRLFSCHVSRNVWVLVQKRLNQKMYTEEGKFRQTEATVTKSTNNSEGKGRVEVLNIKVRFQNN